MIGEQQAPRLTAVQRDIDVPSVEDNAVAFVCRLHTAVLKSIGDHQDNPFRLVAHELTLQIQQPLQDGFPLQVVEFHLIEFLHVNTERLPFMPFG